MSEPAWTKGPWAVDGDDRPGMAYNHHVVLTADPDRRICFMAYDGPARDREFWANARLIAAAPSFADIAARAQRLANERGGDYADLTEDELCAFMAEYDAA